MFGMIICERKGVNYVVVICDKVIIILNELLLIEDEWKGFLRRFFIIYNN